MSFHLNSRSKPLNAVKYSSLWFALRAAQRNKVREKHLDYENMKSAKQSGNKKVINNSIAKSNKKQAAVCLNESNMILSNNESKKLNINVIRVDDNRALILMKPNLSQYELTFGSMRITSLNPNVSVCVNGFNLLENCTIEVMAIFGYRIAFVCNQIDVNSNTDDNHVIKHNIQSLSIDSKFIDIVLDKTRNDKLAVILMERLSSSSLLYLETVNNYSFDIYAKYVWFEIESTENTIYLESQNWNTVFNEINISYNDVIVVCGAKDVGKSSLIRYLINHYIGESLTADNSNNGVYLLDCDPGQSEMTCCAQLSLTHIKKPLLGPSLMNVINFKPIISSAVGFIDVSKNSKFYLKIVVFLLKYFTNNFKSKAPLFINTMGWVKGLGLALLMDTIKLSQPSHVIQIDSNSDAKQNISVDLTAECVTSFSDTLLENQECCSDLNYKLTKIKSCFVKNQSSQPKRNRNLSQLAYISRCNEIVFKPIYAITPIKVNWSQVYLRVVSDSVITTELVLDILNSSWVQLCKIDETNVQILNDNDSIGIRVINMIGENQCYGSAIIRRIDMEEKCFYLITPECGDDIEQINCIVRSDGVTLPNEILSEQFQHSFSSNIPYISMSHNLNLALNST